MLLIEGQLDHAAFHAVVQGREDPALGAEIRVAVMRFLGGVAQPEREAAEIGSGLHDGILRARVCSICSEFYVRLFAIYFNAVLRL